MNEVAWMEINRKGEVVTKRKSFNSQAAAQKFIEKLFEKDNFYSIVATR